MNFIGVNPATESRGASGRSSDTRRRGRTRLGDPGLWDLRYCSARRSCIKPVIGRLPAEEVRPVHIDDVITRIVNAGAPTVANDALRYVSRMLLATM